MFFTLPHLGAGLIAISFTEIAILVWLDKIKPWSMVAFGFLAVVSGAVVANLSNVTDIAMSLGSNSTLHMTRVQEDVDTKAAEVQEINNQLKQLAQQVADSEKTVIAVRDDLRMVVRALVKADFVSLQNLTHNAKTPAVAINDFSAELARLLNFAYPDYRERDAFLRNIEKELELYPTAAATPTQVKPKSN